MSLEQYLKSFSRLRTDKNRKRWSALTTYQAPHSLDTRSNYNFSIPNNISKNL